MHAQQASISASNQIQRNGHQRIDREKSHVIRDTLIGMIEKSADHRTITIAPGIAQRILNEANFHSQRAVTQSRVYDIKRIIQSGTWNPSHVVHFVLLADCGALWLVNGQTRMNAIAETGLPQKVGVVIQKVANEHEARRVYTEFDKATGARTTNQILNASGISEECNLPKQFTVKLFSAVGIIANSMEFPRGSINAEKFIEARNMENRMELISKWTVESLEYLSNIADAGKDIRRQLLRGGTLAVALITYRYQRAKAIEFWSRVADGANLKKNDPRLILSRDLAVRNTAIGMANHSIQQSALAWNNYFYGRDMKILKCTTEWRLSIAGTPYGQVKK